MPSPDRLSFSDAHALLNGGKGRGGAQRDRQHFQRMRRKPRGTERKRKQQSAADFVHHGMLGGEAPRADETDEKIDRLDDRDADDPVKQPPRRREHPQNRDDRNFFKKSVTFPVLVRITLCEDKRSSEN